MRGETQIALQQNEQEAERRRAIRYRMSTSVIFKWKRPDNHRVDGVFVLTATPPPVNALIHMEVILPLSDGASKAQMKADMRVLRVDHDIAGTSRSGFSASGKGFLLRTYSKKASRLVAGLIKDSKESTVVRD
jgi:hypothetical protein